MVLILEVAGPQAAQLGSAGRKVFGVEGGVIGRDSQSAWVLPHPKVSGRHARISHRNGVFYIEDTSTNGVFINASKNRLGKGRPYALTPGDSIFVDPFTISVSVSGEGDEAPHHRFSPPPAGRSAQPHDDPFNLDDPFGEQAVPFGGQIVPSPDDLHSEPLSGQEVDPLELLGRGAPRRQVVRSAPRAQDLERGSPIHGHYKPPPVVASPTSPPGFTPVPAPPGDPFAIPADYDPLAPDTSYRAARKDIGLSAPRTPDASPPKPPPPPPRVEAEPEPRDRSSGPGEIVDEDGPTPAAELDLSMFDAPSVPDAPASEQRPSPASATIPPAAPAPAPVAARASHAVPAPKAAARRTPIAAPPAVTAAPPPSHSLAPAADGMTIDLRSLLEGAGLDPEDVTPDLARNLGEILRVVVAGVMEVLRARHSVKDEFRMRITQFRPADNNPLKFSANVDDALHNLLVKRNAAYLKPVDAFADAFDDLRHHQLAMLAGMRTAFEAMLNELQPDRLREQFDHQGKRSSLLNVAAKLRYWDLYRDMHEELAKDADATFRRLFGDAFATAYEEQLERLKAQNDPASPQGRRREPD